MAVVERREQREKGAGHALVKQAMKKALLVDDHAVVRNGLKKILEEQPGEIEFGEAGTADCEGAACPDHREQLSELRRSPPGGHGQGGGHQGPPSWRRPPGGRQG